MEENILDDELEKGPDWNQVRLAGFGSRAAAAIIDSFIMAPAMMISFWNIANLKSFAFEIFLSCIWVVYKIYMEWKFGATLGKMAIGIKVVNEHLESISLEQSMIRFSFYFINFLGGIVGSYFIFSHPEFTEITNLDEMVAMSNGTVDLVTRLSAVPLLVSIIAVLMEPKKQALHDKLAQTYCIFKKPLPLLNQLPNA